MIANPTEDTPAASGFVYVAALALMAMALVFGGGSRNDALGWMVVELAGLIVLLAASWQAINVRQGRAVYLGYVFLLLVAVIPLLQLAPLPPTVWESLAGRDPLLRAIELTGLTNAWRTISLAPDETQRAVLYLIAPAGMFVAVAQCNERQRSRIALLALVVGLSSLAVGVIQVIGGGVGAGQFYPQAIQGLPNGFFANRNHQAVFLVSCIALAGALPRLNALPAAIRDNPAPTFGLMFLFAVGAAATLSRAGILLLLPVALGSGVVYVLETRARRRWTALITFVIAAVIALALVLALKGGSIWDRFRAGDVGDVRFADYPQIAKIALAYQPLGSGVGSFDLVYRAHERLDQLSPFYLNHAHNDYLELWLEAGAPGAALVFLFLAWWAVATRRAWGPNSRPKLDLARSGALVIGALLLHSLVDYPLRTPALAVLLAFACALLCEVGAGKRPLAKGMSTN